MHGEFDVITMDRSMERHSRVRARKSSSPPNASHRRLPPRGSPRSAHGRRAAAHRGAGGPPGGNGKTGSAWRSHGRRAAIGEAGAARRPA